MAYNSLQLITSSWDLSGVVSQEFQTSTGDQSTVGLRLLNELLAIKSANTDLISYYKTHDFVMTAGVGVYNIQGLLLPETFTFFISSIRYEVQPVGRDDFFGQSRAENISYLPFIWYFERSLGGGNLYVYFKPAQDYAAQIVGKFALSSVTLFQDLSLTLSDFFLVYLRYALAQYMCQTSGYQFPPDKQEMLNEMEKQITNVSPPDMSALKVSLFNSDDFINYGQVNLGKGWRPV